MRMTFPVLVTAVVLLAPEHALAACADLAQLTLPTTTIRASALSRTIRRSYSRRSRQHAPTHDGAFNFGM